MQITKEEKARENRLRRLAEHLGLTLERSRCRTPQAPEYGTYQLVNAGDGTLAAWGLASGYGLTLDDLEESLRSPEGKAMEGPAVTFDEVMTLGRAAQEAMTRNAPAAEREAALRAFNDAAEALRG